MEAYLFLYRAVAAAILTSIVTGILGSYVVARRMVFISGGITHSSFAGLGVGFFMGWSPLLSAAVAAILSGLGVEWLNRRGGVRADSAIAAVWSLGMAIGILFTFMTPGYTPSLTSFLFGNILLVSNGELLLLALFLLLTLVGIALLYWPLLWVSFDPEQCKIRSVKVALYQYGMMVWIAVGIVLSIRTMGIMMLMSMLTLPQMTVALFWHRFHHQLIGSSLYSMVVVLVALVVSFYLNIPTGATAVLLFASIFLLLKGALSLRRPVTA